MQDFCNNTSDITLIQDVDLIMQQIEILLDTTPGEVLGDETFGSDYDRFIHELNVSNTYIEEYIYENIITNIDLFDWELDVHVDLLVGEQNDIILVTISFYKDGNTYTRTYKIDSEL